MTEIETPVGAVVSHMQTDAFCDHCGYNLNTQPVMRDERLGILVSRCPECGRFIAAGQTTAASRVWLNRLVTSLLAGWVLSILLAFALFTLLFAALAFAHAEEGTTMQMPSIPRLGMPRPFNLYAYHRVVRNFSSDEVGEAQAYHNEQMVRIAGTITLSLLLGMLSASFFWHVRGWRRLLPMASPLLACGLCMFAWTRDPLNRMVTTWGVGQIALFLAFDLLGIWAGIGLGRPVARTVLKLFIPPKVRQHLAFLWTTDGLVAPPGD